MNLKIPYKIKKRQGNEREEIIKRMFILRRIAQNKRMQFFA